MTFTDQSVQSCEYCGRGQAITLSIGTQSMILCKYCWQLEIGDFSPLVKGTIKCGKNCRSYAEVTCKEDDIDLCFKHMRDHYCREFEEGFVHVVLYYVDSIELLIEYDFIRHRILISEGDLPPNHEKQDQMNKYLKYRVVQNLEDILELSEDRFAALILKQLRKALLLQDY